MNRWNTCFFLSFNNLYPSFNSCWFYFRVYWTIVSWAERYIFIQGNHTSRQNLHLVFFPLTMCVVHRMCIRSSEDQKFRYFLNRARLFQPVLPNEQLCRLTSSFRNHQIDFILYESVRLNFSPKASLHFYKCFYFMRRLHCEYYNFTSINLFFWWQQSFSMVKIPETAGFSSWDRSLEFRGSQVLTDNQSLLPAGC